MCILRATCRLQRKPTRSIWQREKGGYACLALRDRAMMNRLLPQTGWPGGTRLLVERDEGAIGWAVVHHKRMVDDSRFGDLNVGLISDCFGAPEAAADVLSAADGYLSGQGVDLILSNQSHDSWVRGFCANGYVVLKNKRIFAVSPELKARLEPFAGTMQGLHLTNMDGHGPHGFES